MAVEKTVPGAAAAKTVLVTGGAGYIGSHAVLQLLLAGFRAVVADNLNNSSELAVRRVAALAGDHSRNLSFHKIDLRDKDALENVFASTRFDAVVHFAGLKAVGESVQKPLLYYDNNVNGTVNLLEVMSSHGCKKKIPLIIGPRRPGDAEILFSSTAKAERDLNWKAKYGIDEMCRDQWNWASKNPNGYGSADSIKQNGHRGYGSADPCKQNGQYGSTESVKQNGNGHLH
uniref:Uncharacterized protein n=1 Tax=Avena sativa TaxID=4498 RepID=A0ACD5ZVI3_AVESA